MKFLNPNYFRSAALAWAAAAAPVACAQTENAPAPETPATTAAPAAAAVPAAVTITVPAGARQKFGGFGTSLGNWGGDYQKLSETERATLSRMLWRDLRFNTLRLWANVYEFAPRPGTFDLTHFRRQYVDSGIIADARKNGVTTLLLAPDGLPEAMREKHANEVALKASEADNYAAALAEFIARIKAETGITLEATGVQNEPNIHEYIAPALMVQVVKSLRRELDARGLQSVKIIAPEFASSDGVFYEQVDALKADAEAWKATHAVSSHSYNMAATDDIARRIEAKNGSNEKEYWMTEASENGSEEPGNEFRAASLAARFLNDMNHRVTQWMHFIGFEIADPRDNATRIIAYNADRPAPLKPTVFQKYYTYRQLSGAFDVGATFRDSQSSLDGDMTWTYGQKPRLTASAAQNPDGSWAMGLANYTAGSFLGVQGWSDDKWNKEQGGYTPAQRFRVTIDIAELKGRARPLLFAVQRTGGGQKGEMNGGQREFVTARNGRVEVAVASLEVVTLRSTPLVGDRR
jgi:O-glycosyl hydrolase